MRLVVVTVTDVHPAVVQLTSASVFERIRLARNRPHRASAPILAAPMVMRRSPLLTLAATAAAITRASAMAQGSWDFGRFVSTAATFNSPFAALQSMAGAAGTPLRVAKGDVVWSPTQQNGAEWATLDDVVMGGRSESRVALSSAGLDWGGLVTTDGGGGFAGMRTKPLPRPLDLSACSGIELKVLGDGFRYKCILRDSTDWNGVAWTVSFNTKKSRAETRVRLPFTAFTPTRFARTLADAPPLATERVSTLQLTLSKFEYDDGLNPTFREGEFGLTLLEVRAF